jgi:hypothetical protein
MTAAEYLFAMGILDDLTQANCASCCWWQKDERLHGECRHSPPLPVYDADTGKAFGFWPTTDAEDHCGSHQFRGAQP